MLTTLMLAAALAEPGEAELEARLPERRTVPPGSVRPCAS